MITHSLLVIRRDLKIWLFSIFSEKKKGFCIDIGAHHPNRFSVTRLLYDSGWSGINVDANPDLKVNFVKLRKRDEFVWAAVGCQDIYTFTRFKEPAISTSNNVWATRFIREGNHIIDQIQVPGMSLNQLLSNLPKYQKVDLLNIDVEGQDFDVLQSMHIENLSESKVPRFLVLETSMPVDHALATPAVKLAISWGYIPYMILPMATVLKWGKN